MITGLVLEGSQDLVAWGTGARRPAQFQPGGTILIDEGRDLTVEDDGRHRLVSDTPLSLRRGERIFTTTTAASEIHAGQLRAGAEGRGAWPGLHEHPDGDDPRHDHPDPDRGLCPRMDAVSGPCRADRRCHGPAGRALQLSLIPLLRLHNDLGIGKGYLGIWLAHTGFGLPLGDLSAAQLHGRPAVRGDRIGTRRRGQRIPDLLPHHPAAVVSGTGQLCDFSVLWVWNDLLIATVFPGNTREQLVMTGVLRELMGSKGGEWKILATSAFILIAVLLLVFFAMQKYLVRGLLAGSVKGG